MAKFGELTGNQVEDVLSKIDSSCGGNGLNLFRQGELLLVEKEREISIPALANGGVTYASGLDVGLFIADWQKCYDEVFGLRVNLSSVSLPPFRTGFGWGVAMVPELPVNEVIARLGRRFNISKWWGDSNEVPLDPESEVRTTTNGPYLTWCRDRSEADEEWKNVSANQLKERGINCMTFLERAVLGGWFHWKTGGHLDIKNVTLCAGSRYSGGDIPCAFWGDVSRFYVYRYNADYRYDDIRAREVVSL